MKRFTDKVQQYTFLIGIAVLILSLIFRNQGFSELKPVGIATLIICPLLGTIGVVFSVINRKWLYLLLNALLIPSFFIVMYIGYTFLGP